VKLGTINLHIILSIVYEFCENMDRHDHTFEKLNYFCTCTVNPYDSREVGKVLDIRCNTLGSREFSVLLLCFEEFKEETCRFL